MDQANFRQYECPQDCLHQIVMDRNILKLIYTLQQSEVDVDVRHPHDKTTPLHLAIEKQDQVFIDKLLDKGANVRVKNRAGESALHLAIRSRNRALINQFLARSDVDVNQPAKGGVTALHIAVKNRDNESIEHLLRKKARVNVRDIEGNTPLHYAVLTKNRWIVQQLLRRGADPNRRNRAGDSAVHEATSHFDEMLVLKLLEYGANVSFKNRAGENVLHLASFHGTARIVNTILKMHVNSNERTMDGAVPLNYAVRNNVKYRLSIVTALVKHGANIEAVDRHARTPLMVSIMLHHWDVTNYLIELGANVNVLDLKLKMTPLLIAMTIPNIWLTMKLLKHGAKVNLKTPQQETPLHLAVRKFQGMNRLRVVKQLLAQGAKINEGNIKRSTALHLAIQTKDSALINLLIDEGASIHLKNLMFESPYNLIIKYRMVTLTRSLLAKLKNGKIFDQEKNYLLSEAVRGNSLYMVKFLLRNGVNAVDPESILIAGNNGNPCIIAELLSNGADVNAVSPETGLSVLDNAIFGKHPTAVQLLLKDGANVNHLSNGEVVLSRAVWFRNLFHNRHFEWIVYELIKHIVLLKKQKRFVHQLNWELIEKDQTMSDTVKLFQQDIENMKQVAVCNNKVTYYDLLTNHGTNLAKLYMNKDVKSKIITGVYKKYGFLYSQELCTNYNHCIERKLLLEMCRKSLHDIFKNTLPYDTICYISEYLSNYDIKVQLKTWRKN